MSLLNRTGGGTLALALSLCVHAAAADVVTIVSAKNTVSVLSKSQVADIFLGKTSRFPDGSQAVPIDQPEDSAVRKEFYSRIADKSPAQLKSYWSKIIFTGRGQPPQEATDGAEVKKRILGNPNAIGYIERNDVDDSVKVLPTQ